MTLKNNDTISIGDLKAVVCVTVNEPLFANLYRPNLEQTPDNHVGQIYIKPSKGLVILYLSNLPVLLNRQPRYEFDINHFFENVKITSSQHTHTPT